MAALMKRFANDGTRLTDCCGAYSTFHDETLCCKACHREVEFGQGDGSERLAERLGGRPNGDYVVRRIYAGRTGGWARKGLFLARSWDDAKLVFIPVTDLCDSRWSVVATSTTEET